MTTKNVKHIYGNGSQIVYVRLTADKGKVLTNGVKEWNCVDVFADDVENWHEVDAPIIGDEDATETDYLNALAELGVQ